MKYRNRFLSLTNIILILAILSLTIVACWGDVGYTVNILHLTDQNLTIFVTVYPAEYIKKGNVEPGKEIQYEEIYYDKSFYELKNTQGEVFYSKEFTFAEMEEMDWEVVITQ